MMINMIFKILLPLTVWCMGVVAQDVFEVPGTAEGSIATSCEKLYLHFANTTHNQVTLSLFGFCTYDGQPHDFVSEPQLFRKTGIDLSHVVINDKQNFCWAAKDINARGEPDPLNQCRTWKITGTIISATCLTFCKENAATESSGPQCKNGHADILKHLNLDENIINSNGELFYKHNLNLQQRNLEEAAVRAAQVGGFKDSCTDYSLGRGPEGYTSEFTANCKGPTGGYRTTILNLDSCIKNDAGVMKWSEAGGYTNTCEEQTCTLYFTSMTCWCIDNVDVGHPRPSFIQLNETVRNDLGHLACFDHIGS